MDTLKIDLLLGTVVEVKDRQTYEILADIPGVAVGVRAYPYSRGEMDEPVVGNLVYLISVDPVYNSFFLYTKAKENDFIGIRSNGKMIDITPDYISLGVYDTEKTNKDDERPELNIGKIRMDSSGNLDIEMTGNSTVKVSGNSTIEVSGNADIKVSGSCNIDSPDVNITGASLTVKGTATPTGDGPFCGIPACLFTGYSHISSKSVGN